MFSKSLYDDVKDPNDYSDKSNPIAFLDVQIGDGVKLWGLQGEKRLDLDYKLILQSLSYQILQYLKLIENKNISFHLKRIKIQLL